MWAAISARARANPTEHRHRFAKQLTPLAGGVTPDLPDIASLIRTSAASPPGSRCSLSNEGRTIVGMARRRITVVGEAKWTTRPLDVTILRDLAEYKLPALEQAGFTVSPSCRSVLYSRSGYTDRLRRQAEAQPQLHLVSIAALSDTRCSAFPVRVSFVGE